MMGQTGATSVFVQEFEKLGNILLVWFYHNSGFSTESTLQILTLPFFIQTVRTFILYSKAFWNFRLEPFTVVLRTNHKQIINMNCDVRTFDLVLVHCHHAFKRNEVKSAHCCLKVFMPVQRCLSLPRQTSNQLPEIDSFWCHFIWLRPSWYFNEDKISLWYCKECILNIHHKHTEMLYQSKH